MTQTEQLTKELKEILPDLINLKELGEKIDPAFNKSGENESKIKELSDQLKNIGGSITELEKKSIELGKKKN